MVQEEQSPDVAQPRDARSRSSQDDPESLLHRMAACAPGPEREALRVAAITAFLPVARRLARRYGSPVDSREDLYQVACLGLVRAVDRFQADRGHAFLSYAVPTIDGELKRHLRDHTWHVHVPRTVQERHRQVRRAQEELRRTGLPHGGSTREIALLTGIPEADIRLVLRADAARNPLSVDEQRGPERGTSLAESLGAEDAALERVTDKLALDALVLRLPERERRVLNLYFVECLTQREVADIIGVSQMHVSRLLRRACATLRHSFLDG
ncbi:sigma-70 family RNA polymerase sigma factor [Streptomyces viridochromogenes]|uniref:Putative RNA polymerase sigma factor n=1 Tax=Streptomyces viridochromogenes Tue57 TaxID=1160705 RepID=L8NZZ7_STRVR|nr:sigma-70 family RNA polymerase sigma factor [Streptomyces viridochromogenes]ELS50881.1 putative RNA polymerase sigma factor [Streptomyces viridochromogenes Tue57]